MLSHLKIKNKTIQKINFNIKWEVVKKVKPFAPGDKVCNFCIQEKLSILRSAPSLKKNTNFLDFVCIRNDSK